ncbi:hypothetical protein GW17_00030344 [Ensete ventricosum]|nr:hypothetical protein GW17_00030344 [Ensete ventricosum]
MAGLLVLASQVAAGWASLPKIYDPEVGHGQPPDIGWVHRVPMLVVVGRGRRMPNFVPARAGWRAGATAAPRPTDRSRFSGIHDAMSTNAIQSGTRGLMPSCMIPSGSYDSGLPRLLRERDMVNLRALRDMPRISTVACAAPSLTQEKPVGAPKVRPPTGGDAHPKKRLKLGYERCQRAPQPGRSLRKMPTTTRSRR